MNPESDGAADQGQRPRALSWWLLLIPALLAVTGFLAARQYSLPPLFGSWLASAAQALLGIDQTEYLRVPFVNVWAWTAVVGLAASLYVMSVGSWKPNRLWPLVRAVSWGTVPFLVTTAMPLFAWPFIWLVPGAALAVPFSAAASIACVIKTIRLGLRPSSLGLLRVCQVIFWSLLTLVCLDWANMLLIGGS